MFLRGTFLRRAEDLQCSSSLLQTCGQGLPGNFCCPAADTVCMALASNTTAVCCPKGQACDLVYPITCDIQAQNAMTTATSVRVFFTTALGATLPLCGSGCCPFGYECDSVDGEEICVLAKDQTAYSSLVSQTGQIEVATGQTIAAIMSGAASTSATTTTSSLASSAFVDATESPTNNGAATSITGGGGSRRLGTIAGCSVGIVALVACIVFIVWKKKEKINCLQRRKHQRSKTHRGLSSDHSAMRPPSYEPPKSGKDDKKYPPIYRVTETQVRCKTPRLTLGPFGNNPPFPFFTRSSIQVPPYTPSAELHVSSMLAEVIQTSTRHVPKTAEVELSPVELPASPLSFSLWERQRKNSRTTTTIISIPPPQATVPPLSRFALMRKPLPPDERDNFF